MAASDIALPWKRRCDVDKASSPTENTPLHFCRPVAYCDTDIARELQRRCSLDLVVMKSFICDESGGARTIQDALTSPMTLASGSA